MTLYDLALLFTPGLGAKGINNLIDLYGSAEAVFRASAGELRGRGELRVGVVDDIIARTEQTL